jgi:hypothetical protein
MGNQQVRRRDLGFIEDVTYACGQHYFPSLPAECPFVSLGQRSDELLLDCAGTLNAPIRRELPCGTNHGNDVEARMAKEPPVFADYKGLEQARGD